MSTKIENTKPRVFLFHPTSVIILILLDWGGFLLEIPQVLSPVSLVLTFGGIFLFTSMLIFFLQQHFAGETKKDALIKAFLGGLICAVPAPVMASFIGSIILALSGFENLKQFGIEGITRMFRKQERGN